MALTAEVTRTGIESDQRLLFAVVISVLLHTILVLYLSATEQPKILDQERLIEVTLQPVVEKQKPKEIIEVPKPLPKQMITPPDLPEAIKPPENTRFLSDKNTVTEKEQIKRGDGGTPPKPLAKAQPKKDLPPQEKPEKADEQKERGPLKPLSEKSINLKLNPDTLSALANNPQEAKGSLRNLSRYQPFSKGSTSNDELFRFRSGAPDFLPNIPDGEMTMLNAKADKFAPFVRRVAGQVFGMVRKLQWHNIPASDVMRISDFTTVEAVLNPQGKLLKVTLHGPSGSSSFDKVILQSVQTGANDQNPPQGVQAEDGNIHFIFKSRCWTRPGAAGIPDNRWLLLSTGLL